MKALKIPLEQYIRDCAPRPSLSSSIAHLLLTRSPRHARLAHPKLNPEWKPDDPTTDSEIGSAVHALLLEDDSAKIHTVDADSWRTDKAKEVRKLSRENHMIPLLTKDRDRVEAIVQAAKAAILDAPEIKAAFAKGHSEMTYVWREGEQYCRTRPDREADDYRLVIDVKVTGASAEPNSWARGQMLNMSYDLQAAFQLRAVKLHHRPKTCSFLNLVIENEPPYAVSFIGLDPAFEDFAERKRLAAVELWKHCMETGTWPSYPARICWVSPPEWALTRWEDSRVAGGVEEL